MTWEEAIKDLRSNPENHQSILDNYFDVDIDASVERFYKSDEYNALLPLIPKNTKNILDIGAGRGLASYAFAKSGYEVTALEPDPSNDVGAGAIKYLATKHNLPIQVVETFGESLPFPDNSFDVVYVRQVLHHAHDLEKFCKEVSRVLKHGGIFIATREHVLSKESDLAIFLNNHPLHKHYGGEHAFTLRRYMKAIEGGGLTITKVIHPYASVINYAPLNVTEIKSGFAKTLAKVIGNNLATTMMNISSFSKFIMDYKAATFHQPGRLYSFIAIKK